MRDFEITPVLLNRKSCRTFKKSIPFSPLELKNMVWAANQAPYASGGPRYTIYYTTEEKEKTSIVEACMNQKYVGEAGVIFIFCSDDDQSRLRQGDLKANFDISAACMCMDLYATSFGYGTCWIGNFIPERIKKHTGVKGRPVILLLVGAKAVPNVPPP